ncbi:MAG: alpha-galactosidase, partial [Pseudomonadota bacterium]
MTEGAKSDGWHGANFNHSRGDSSPIEGAPSVQGLGLSSRRVVSVDKDIVMLSGGGVLVIIAADYRHRPMITYCGPDLPNANPEQLAMLSMWQYVDGSAAQDRPISLSNELSTGTLSPPGLSVSRNGEAWAVDLRVESVQILDDTSVQIRCLDARTEVKVCYTLQLNPVAGVLTCSTEIENLAERALALDWCAGLCLPLDPRLSEILAFSGRWSGEFQLEEIGTFQGSYVRENRAGRTSHECFPGLILKSATADENQGLACGFHLAWSGNHRSRVDRLPDGRSLLQMGELLLPGEITLGAGESYRTPDMLAAWTSQGIGAISQAFQAHLTDEIIDERGATKPRLVHFNTWEAVYFDHDQERIIELAELAAAVGAERFVLDDGWFGSRRNDASGLGDWWVAPDIYSDGLHPIVNKVRELDMEFGLWFEPEMVNPDSDLYRAHPDWVLEAPGVDPIAFRNQLTLNLSKSEVSDYLYEKVSALVDEYKIDYIKWDMNRDCHHPGYGTRAA